MQVKKDLDKVIVEESCAAAMERVELRFVGHSLRDKQLFDDVFFCPCCWDVIGSTQQ